LYGESPLEERSMSDEKPKPKLPQLDVDAEDVEAHIASSPADEPPEKEESDEPDVELHGQFFN
jgi:hypothetical protein